MENVNESEERLLLLAASRAQFFEIIEYICFSFGFYYTKKRMIYGLEWKA